MINYDKMSQEEFDEILTQVINEDLVGESYTSCGSRLLSIPGIYEVLSEHYNNEVLDVWARRNPEKAGLEESDDA